MTARSESVRSAPFLEIGPLGATSCVAFSLALVILAQGWHVAIPFGFVTVLCAARVLTTLGRVFRNRMFLSFLVSTVLLGGLLGPEPVSVAGLSISPMGLTLGIQVALRGATVSLAIVLFSTAVSIMDLTGLLEWCGLKGLGFATGVALNMLPTAYANLTTSYYAMRLRGGFRRAPLRSLRLLLTTVVANCLRHADQIVCAAETRAFTLEQIRPAPITWGRSDRVLIGMFLVLTLILIVIR